MPLTLASLVPFLIALIVICIILYGVSLVLSMIALPAPVKQLVWLVIGLVVLLVLLNLLGIVHQG